jgi:Fe-S-cluster-containing hydrogenase component 2
LLPAAARELLGSDPATLQPAQRQEIVHGLNELIKNRQLPDLKELQPLASSPRLASARPASKKTGDWSDLELRQFNRLLLEEALPDALVGLKRSKGPLTILSYRGRGEFFGEMGLMLKQPRSASCVAYVHPLPEGTGPLPVYLRAGDLVEMVRIPEQTFWDLVNHCPELRVAVENKIAIHQKADVQRLQEPIWDNPRHVQTSKRFSELGLVQGQRLMLIDLDRCTRCDECVQACVHSHTDGRSRLFLEGPRFGKYLVPATCRSCLEPVCMIGCPVGSIHRGDNRQIVIEDWCIGCGLCARNCPYGSIQMHDLGLVPSEARDWHFLPAETVQSGPWNKPGYRDTHWLSAKAPFFADPDLYAQLANWLRPVPEGEEQAVCFRREFQLSREMAQHAKEYKLEITSTDESASVWVNGIEIQTKERAKRGVRPFLVAQEAGVLQVGRNVVAVRVKVQPGKEGPLFDMRLDEVRVPVLPAGSGDFTEKSYGQLAVVCDLCSSQYGQRPACVTACPHDAAMRVDARFEFPEQ